MDLMKIEDADKYLHKAQEVMASVDSSMTSTDFRFARTDINAELNRIDAERVRLRKEMLAEFDVRFKEHFNVEQIESYKEEVQSMMNNALKVEEEKERARIEEIIDKVNDGQVDRNLLGNYTAFKGKSESYINSHIQDKIDDIIFSEEEKVVAPEPPQPEKAKPEFVVTMTVTTKNKDLAREIQNLCRKAGEKVAIKKG